MNVTIVGIFLILLSIIFFMFSSKLLYTLFIFFIPFSATSVVNFGSSFGIQPYYYLCLIVLFRIIIDKLINYKTQCTNNGFENHKLKKFLALLFLFVLIVFLSLLMPIIIDGKLLAFDPKSSQYMPIEFTFSGLRFVLYLLIGVISTILIIVNSKSVKLINYVIKVYVVSSVFVALWGLFQLVTFKLNIPYPNFIFNNSVSFAADGYMQNISDINATRISSVAVEASIFSQYVLTSASILLYMISRGFKLFSALKDKLFAIILIISLSLSTSTTAYIGLVFMFLLIFIINSLENTNFTKLYVYLCIVILSIFVIYYLYNNFYNVKIIMDTFILGKSNTYSGQDRLSSIKNAWNYFSMYPILGVGWRFITSNDLIVNLLANIGILGCLSFFLLIGYILNNLIKILNYLKHNKVNNEIKKYIGGVICSFITLIFINCITGFSYNLGHFWFIIGISMAIIIVFYKDTSIKSKT